MFISLRGDYKLKCFCRTFCCFANWNSVSAKAKLDTIKPFCFLFSSMQGSMKIAQLCKRIIRMNRITSQMVWVLEKTIEEGSLVISFYKNRWIDCSIRVFWSCSLI